MAVYLTKDEELELGTRIQKARRIQELQAKDNDLDSYTVDGVTFTPDEAAEAIVLGDKAIKKLLESNSALVWSRARLFKSKNPYVYDLEDLVQDGFIGLLRAAEKYDPTRGNKFSTVAFYWIDQAIARSVNKTARLIRLPENRVQDFYNISKIRASYEESNLSQGEIDQIAMSELDLTLDEFTNITRAAAIPTSLSRPVNFGDSSDSRELIDYIADTESGESTEDTAIREGMRSILFEKFQVLSEIEREVIVASFLIEDPKTKRRTMRELTEVYSLTPAKMKKILTAALEKLQEELSGLDITFADFLD